MKDRQSKLLPLIAAFKILKACSLFALAFGLHHLRHGNAETILLDWCRDVRLDPDDKIPHFVITKMTGLPTGRLHELGIGIFFYGLLFGTEGVGLMLKQRWAEYMTVFSTVLFLPLEAFELIVRPHRKLIKACVFLANIAIMLYLIANLRRAKLREQSLKALDPRIEFPES